MMMMISKHSRFLRSKQVRYGWKQLKIQEGEGHSLRKTTQNNLQRQRLQQDARCLRIVTNRRTRHVVQLLIGWHIVHGATDIAGRCFAENIVALQSGPGQCLRRRLAADAGHVQRTFHLQANRRMAVVWIFVEVVFVNAQNVMKWIELMSNFIDLHAEHYDH